jgi:putative flippase GtrA
LKQGALHQLVRYGIVGGIVYAADFGAFALLMWLMPDAYLPANIVGKTTGACVGFLLHKKFSFSWDQKDSSKRQAAAYLLLFGTNLAASSLLMWFLVDYAKANAFIAKLFVDGIVIAASFVANRLWVYRAA